MFKRALVSTSDKTGLVEFLKPLADAGCEIVSTGGTSKFLRDNHIKVREVADVTGFPEMMDGRVRTLHPKIHMGLLARSFVPEDMDILKEHDVQPFDLVVVNLYPFEAAFKKGLRGQELIEQIDIGGPSLLRASAKSFERVTVVCDPSDYTSIMESKKNGNLDEKFRKNLAVKVYEHCAFYDSIVSNVLRETDWTESKTETLGLRKKEVLRYGENPHQKAVWYETPTYHPLSLSSAQQLQGKELSYNNILDLEAAVGVAADFEEPACAIIKHLTPCGVALDQTINGAYKKALEGDPVSAFGGIVALNRPVNAELAQALIGLFLECVVAPAVDKAALEILSSKKNLRVLVLENLTGKRFENVRDEVEFKSLRGGALMQTCDKPAQWSSEWKVVGSQPDDHIKRDLIFAQRVVRHVKSNAIVIVKNLQTLGVCGGQTNRVDSVKWALERAKGRGKDLVLGSDAFFPFRDSIDLIHNAKANAEISWIIQPGGSMRDAEVEQAAQEHKINMVITKTRHFKH